MFAVFVVAAEQLNTTLLEDEKDGGEQPEVADRKDKGKEKIIEDTENDVHKYALRWADS